MMRIPFALALCVLLFGLPGVATAWQPCQPFCDSGCGGSALNSMGQGFSSAASGVSSANESELNAENTVNQSLVQLGADVSTELTTSTFNILSSLDAQTGKLELAEIQNVKHRESLTDLTIQSLFNAHKELLVSGDVSATNLAFDEIAQPGTGDLFVSGAQAVRKGHYKAKDLVIEKSKNFAAYLDHTGRSDKSVLEHMRSGQEWDFATHFKLSADGMNDAYMQTTEQILSYLASASPDAYPETASEDAQLAHLRHKAKTQMLASTLFRNQSLRFRLIDKSWISHYLSDTSADGKLSLIDYLRGTVEGRLESEGWHSNMMLTSTTGLLRERAYLKAEENVILYLVAATREARNQVLALTVGEAVLEQSNRLKALR